MNSSLQYVPLAGWWLRGSAGQAFPRMPTVPGPGHPRGFTCELAGFIASAGFASGHRFVVGIWDDSPLGPMSDLMWARPDGERVLLAGRRDVADFITAVYRFDRVEIRPLECRWDGPTLRVDSGDLTVSMRCGRNWRIPFPRIRSLGAARRAEALVARHTLGVRTFGTSPTGVFEWYRADRYRRVVAARASLCGVDLGSVARFRSPAGFGFSEPPRWPSVVRVRPLLIDPSGDLARVVPDTAR